MLTDKLSPATLPAFSTERRDGTLRTVLVTHEYAPFRGGVATYVREVALAARSLGLPVSVWTVSYQGREHLEAASRPGVDEFAKDDFPVTRLRSNGRLTPWGWLSFASGLWRRRSELTGARLVLASVGAQMAFFLLFILGSCPSGEIICFFHGSEVLRFRRSGFWRVLSRRFYRREGVRLVASSVYVRKLLAGSGLAPVDAVIDLAPCALPRAFHVEQNPPADELPAAKQWVLTVARLHPRKGQREIAQALAMLPEEWKRRVVYQMIGVGDEAYRQEVEQVCRSGGVTCEFSGALDDRVLARAYARATLYAQASRTLPQSVEGFGITFLEAGVHGCPAAAWRSGGVEEAVLDGETGLLVEEGDVAGLSAAIGKLLAKPDLRQRLGATARNHARSLHWEHAARVLCGVTAEK